MAKPIRLKHQLFVHYYLACSLNGAKAARDAGYSRKNARYYASRLLRKANVREYLAVMTKAMIDRHNAGVGE
jgi:phage terminase small subunit